MAQVTFSIKEERSENNKIRTKKTTVSIPAVLIEKIQLYIAQNPRANLRDQSTIITLALLNFLNQNLETKHQLMPCDVLSPGILERFNIPDPNSIELK
jgi:hypothetical protein